MRSIVARVAEDSPLTKANRDSWNATSKEYQARHHSELEGDVLWGPSMPPERELKILGESAANKSVLEIACGGGPAAGHPARIGATSRPLTSPPCNSSTRAPSPNPTTLTSESSRPAPCHPPNWST